MLDEVALGELGSVLERPEGELERPAVVQPEREALDRVDRGGVDGDDDARRLGRPRRERERRDDRADGEQPDDERQGPLQPAVQDDAAPVLPGAWSGVPSAQRGQVSGPGS